VFPLKFGSQVLQVTKIQAQDFTPEHHDVLASLEYEPGKLLFSDLRWHSLYLGAGEEKAVFCVCDHHQRVFSLELIDERTYLNGRFVGGTYFFNKRIASLSGRKAHSNSEFGLTFSGLIKVREFVHGYEWSRFQFDPSRRTALDGVLTFYLKSIFESEFRQYQAHYRDVHDRNVLFEIRPADQPGVPIIVKTWANRLAVVRVGLQPVDVR
jgi:hypothetical protein